MGSTPIPHSIKVKNLWTSPTYGVIMSKRGRVTMPFIRTDNLKKYSEGDVVEDSEFYDVIAVADDETFILLDYLKKGGYVEFDSDQTFIDDF